MAATVSTMTRRRLLAVTGATAAASFAGCTYLADEMADRVLGEVTVFNATDRRVAGSIAIEDPAGETVLDEPFDLTPEDDEAPDAAGGDDSDGVEVNEPEGTWDDVWTEAGPYEVTVELDESVEDTDAATASVEIEDPEEDMLAIPIGAEDRDDPIDFVVAQRFSEFQSDE